MLEWLKRHAWKACIRQKRIPSSNLGHSAKKDDNLSSFFLFKDNWNNLNNYSYDCQLMGCSFLIGGGEEVVDEGGDVGDVDVAVAVQVGVGFFYRRCLVVHEIVDQEGQIADVY